MPHPRRSPRRAPALIGLLLLSCTAVPTAPTTVPPPPHARTPLPPLFAGELALVGVHVISMREENVLRDRTVVIHDGRIREIGPADEVDIGSAVRIDGAGRHLVPGLIDMHVHPGEETIDAFTDAGITTVRAMAGTERVAGLRTRAAAGEMVPTVFSAGPVVDGSPPVWPGSDEAMDPAAGAAAVRRHADEGWDFVKVYNRLPPPVYQAILAEAAAVGITVVGHIPLAATLMAGARGGHASVEHLTGIGEEVAGGRFPAAWVSADAARAGAVARDLAGTGAWVTPTLGILAALADQYLTPGDADRAKANQRMAVKALRDAGVPILAGTDAGIGPIPAGISLAAELELLVEAGLSPYEALAAATSEAARFLDLEDEIGTIAVGARADLILLDGNPLVDISAVREPALVILRGAVARYREDSRF